MRRADAGRDARGLRSTLLGVEAPGGHGEDVAGDGIENLEGIAGGADADVGEGGLLHRAAEGGVMGKEGAGLGGGVHL